MPSEEISSIWLHYYFGKHGTVQSGKLGIPLKQVYENLVLTTRTFRDKLSPGKEESWELTINGPGKDKVNAELLALMYDASLDQFAANRIYFSPRPPVFAMGQRGWHTDISFNRSNSLKFRPWNFYHYPEVLRFEDLSDFGFSFVNPSFIRSNRSITTVGSTENKFMIPELGTQSMLDEVVLAEQEGQQASQSTNSIQIRRNLQETAFFYPNLLTDKEGNVRIRFTTPESLTEWKFMALAHTKDLKTGYLEKTARTAKELMVVPNVPRFLRMGDELQFSTKIINMSERDLSGTASLSLFNAWTMEAIDLDFSLSENSQRFEVDQGKSGDISWTLRVPSLNFPIVYRVTAQAGNFSDGEEAIVPLLSKRQLVTESIAIYAREGQDKVFELKNLLEDRPSSTREHVNFVVELASNPLWFAIQALPSLTNSPHQNAEAEFSVFYSGMISSLITEQYPQIRAVFDYWNNQELLKSRLEANDELKSILLTETPWVNQAEDEATRMKKLAQLFDENTLKQQRQNALRKLHGMQLPSGAFPWFSGGPENHRITTHIVAGLGHLKTLYTANRKPGTQRVDDLEPLYEEILRGALLYLDERARDTARAQDGLHYLYARSYFLDDFPMDKNQWAGMLSKQEKNTSTGDLSARALLLSVYQRTGESRKAQKMIRSLKDQAVISEEMGMYWKANVSGWSWWQSPIETQALLIEAFHEAGEHESVEQMKVWLLKNKQTNHWSSSKATTEAIYALLLSGENWLGVEPGVRLRVGRQEVPLAVEDVPDSYRKISWQGGEIKPQMGRIQLSKTTPGVAWGGVHWQYFQDLDEIQASGSGAYLEKGLFLKKNTGSGTMLQAISGETPIKVGDIVTVRLVIRADRDLQFMHLKDMRAGGFEPTSVLSVYKWQDGLGYYESTADVATNFFFDYLPKGTYVFEYDLRASHAGQFSGGISTLQSIYAPEMNTQTQGIKLKIENK